MPLGTDLSTNPTFSSVRKKTCILISDLGFCNRRSASWIPPDPHPFQLEPPCKYSNILPSNQMTYRRSSGIWNYKVNDGWLRKEVIELRWNEENIPGDFSGTKGAWTFAHQYQCQHQIENAHLLWWWFWLRTGNTTFTSCWKKSWNNAKANSHYTSCYSKKY